MESLSWLSAVGSLLVPIFSQHLAFGPIPWPDVLLALLLMTSLCVFSGYVLTRRRPLLLTRLLLMLCPLELRDEAWEEVNGQEPSSVVEGLGPKRHMRKRSGGELLFIVAWPRAT